MQKVSRISLCVVVGLLFLALIWKFAGAQLAKKGIVLSNDTAAKTVSETAPEAEDGSGNAGIKKLAETTRRAGGTQRMPQRTTSTAGQISTETSTILIPMVTWRPAGNRSAEKAVTLMTRVFTSRIATVR